MSVISKPFYALACDQPGCERHTGDPDEEQRWWESPETAMDMAEQYDEWQIVAPSFGEGAHQYCPEHIHATCCKCGKTAVGWEVDLEEAGWSNPREGYAQCPKCREKQQEER